MTDEKEQGPMIYRRTAPSEAGTESVEPITGDQQCCANTDRELWREHAGDYYSDSLHVTETGGVGINCGGTVFVKRLKDWHALAASLEAVEQTALLACPFCGSSDVELLPARDAEWSIVCHGCHVGTGHSPSVKAVRDSWNTRSDPSVVLDGGTEEEKNAVMKAHHVLGCLTRALNRGAMSMNPATLTEDIKTAFFELDAAIRKSKQ